MTEPPLYAQPYVQMETVVLLHGIGMSGKSMWLTERALRRNRYHAVNISYPSTSQTIEQSARFVAKNHLDSAFWENSAKVHFVTHSMGGLVARTYLEIFRDSIPAEKMGNVVMLAPPNQGSEIADLLHTIDIYEWVYGPAGQELITEKQPTVIPYYNLGVIAGTTQWPYIVARHILKKPGDGRVTVESTKLTGMKDHLTLSATHSFVMNKPAVHKQILAFLKNSEFDHEH